MTRKEFTQITWDAETADDCRQLIRLAVREDLRRGCDLTTVALVPQEARGAAEIMCRERGVIAGLHAAEAVLCEMNADVECQLLVDDGARLEADTPVARLAGASRDLLTVERPVLNFLGRLSGIATLTRRYVDEVGNRHARIYDTRKTTPAWRRLEKYAVRCGGGTNHRSGLFDAVLIKDNHLAQGDGTLGDAIRSARAFLERQSEKQPPWGDTIVEIEVDTLDQLADVLPASPDIVLLDNMTCDQLREAVKCRNSANVVTELEASGGITLESVRAVAETGVERISIGALTHSAVGLDVGLDWLT